MNALLTCRRVMEQRRHVPSSRFAWENKPASPVFSDRLWIDGVLHLSDHPARLHSCVGPASIALTHSCRKFDLPPPPPPPPGPLVPEQGRVTSAYCSRPESWVAGRRRPETAAVATHGA